ncbi:MAG: polyprenol monophosphomannose synthase [Chthoniobacterales bacterium]|nr:polyprenol monophosphomannose synthase [Chthoniobacterales bacterium]
MDFKTSFTCLQTRPTLVVIPTYNELTNLPHLVERLLALPEIDILVVDDNSPDGTGRWVLEEAKKTARLHLLSRQEKNGLGRAYLAGFQWALEQGYEYIIQMDADFSHNPDDVPKLLSAIQEQQADLAIGSRYVNGVRVINWPLRRLILSVGASYYVHFITGLPIHDPTGGFKCWRRRTLEAINIEKVKSNGYGFQIEMSYRAWRKGFSIVEVPIIFTDRFQGTSKMSWSIVFEAFFMVWRLLIKSGFRRSFKTVTPQINS